MRRRGRRRGPDIKGSVLLPSEMSVREQVRILMEMRKGRATRPSELLKDINADRRMRGEVPTSYRAVYSALRYLCDEEGAVARSDTGRGWYYWPEEETW